MFLTVDCFGLFSTLIFSAYPHCQHIVACTCLYCSWRILLLQIFIIPSGNAILLKLTDWLSVCVCVCEFPNTHRERDRNHQKYKQKEKKSLGVCNEESENWTELLTTSKWYLIAKNNNVVSFSLSFDDLIVITKKKEKKNKP